MQARFTKMQALGNDFVVIDLVRGRFDPNPAQASLIADRHRGVGCDQLLLLEPPRDGTADFHFRVMNADGSEVGQCGNGVRCAARYAREEGLTDKSRLVMSTSTTSMAIELGDGDEVSVNMGRPVFDPVHIPFDASVEAVDYALEIAGETLRVAALAIGNPHAVIRVDDVGAADVAVLGAAVESHPRFPERVNAGFLEADAGGARAKLRVFERGVGETLACGSGACAAVVAGVRWGLFGPDVNVTLPGGDLAIRWAGSGSDVWMSGPADRVFDGVMEID